VSSSSSTSWTLRAFRRKSRFRAIVALILMLLYPWQAWGREGTIALVNVSPHGAELVLQGGQLLRAKIGGWARQSSIAAFLAAQPNPGALPTGDVGQELVTHVERLRGKALRQQDLSALGRLLGVDYLLLFKIYPQRFTATLYSVPRQLYAPQSLEASRADLSLIVSYVQTQTRTAAKAAPARWTRWWFWALAAGVGGLTLGLALTAKDDSSGSLRIRVER
jgi:hypothetical protein